MNAPGEEPDWWRHGLCKHVCLNNGGSFLPHNICQNLTNERKVRFGFGQRQTYRTCSCPFILTNPACWDLNRQPGSHTSASRLAIVIVPINALYLDTMEIDSGDSKAYEPNAIGITIDQGIGGT